MLIGSVFQQGTGGLQFPEPDRLYVQPGMMVKFEAGSGLEVQGINDPNTGLPATRQPSINVGVRTYINEFDANPNLSPVLVTGA